MVLNLDIPQGSVLYMVEFLRKKHTHHSELILNKYADTLDGMLCFN